MQYAQFRMIPPLTKVKELFEELTATTFCPGATWSTWVSQPNSALYEVFRPYIRPSHQTLLNTVVAAGPSAYPLPFLRQLLRPHGFRIEATAAGWALHEKSDNGRGIVTLHTKVAHITWD
jgi:hypothetical protein